MKIERLHQALDSLGQPTDARELSEILWLACHTSSTQTAEAPPAPDTTHDDLPPPEDISESPQAPHSPPQQQPDQLTTELHPRPPESQSGSDAREILVPTAPMLTNPLGVQRALRPLKRRVASPLRTELDEDATAARIAETALWVPVLTPAPERWLSLNLVVDTGPSMRLWQPLGRELAETIVRQGAFRDLHLTYLNESGGISSSPTGPARSPTTLLDPAGRHTTLVLSDCSGPHWWNGRAPRALRRWAQTGPTAILQPLPERLWRRTAAPTTPGLASLPRPGAPNTKLDFTPYDGEAPDGLPIPVLEIAPRWLSGWANLVAGAGPQPAAMATPTATTAAPVQRERELPPEERVRRFLVTASPEAAELAAHVAVSIPLLPVMRLIQHRVLGESGPGQLAEVLLSGLLRPVDHSIGHYEFVPGARAALLASLPRPEAWHTRHVLEQVSAEIEPRIGSAAETFRALLPSAQGDQALPDRPFALISPEARALLDRTITPPPPPAPAVPPFPNIASVASQPPPPPQVQAPPIAARPAGSDVVHLSGVRMTDYVDGKLSGEELVRALAHLADCDSCRQEADVLRLVRDRVRGTASSPPSNAADDRPEPAPGGRIRRFINRFLPGSAEAPSDRASLFQTPAQPIPDWTRRVDEWEPVTLGANDDGPVRLDVMDGFMPGHGLIIDRQLSGRSQLVRTLVTELAVAHPPAQLNFLLADYSAGSTFTGGIEELPHVADVITNIANELSLADRLGEALVHELDRRQSLLDAARSIAWHHYQSSVTQGEPIPPLPALFVLVNAADMLFVAKPELQDVIRQVVERGPLLGMQVTMISTRRRRFNFDHAPSWYITVSAEGCRLDVGRESTEFKLLPRTNVRALARTLSEREPQAHWLMPRRQPEAATVESAPGTDLQLRDLGLGAPLGTGGMSTLYSMVSVNDELLYKEYRGRFAETDADAVARLVSFPATLSAGERKLLLSQTAWPVARVLDGDRVAGVVIPRAPERFYGRFGPRGADSVRVRELSYLLSDRRTTWGESETPPEAGDRLEIVQRIAALFQLLHSHSLVIGDVTTRTILWASRPAEIYLLNCDGMRFAGTPMGQDWHDPLGADQDADPDGDRYKLALLIVRVLAQIPHLRPGDRIEFVEGIPPRIAASVSDLFREARGPVGTRPTADQWVQALGVET
ncbi:SAV_2336 N-terminal domain-related protein [Actinomadura sp. 6N118]|uniref:SAV_2336 N-terminal domain-related protein n=1 Tax=Actinomadura sp. 6N118 TaxID=3375151 RepID=UPI0037946597